MECGLGFPQMNTLLTYPLKGQRKPSCQAAKISWNCPHWLKGPETKWPKHPKDDANDTLVMMAVADSQESEYLEDIVNPLRTSKYLCALRSVALGLSTSCSATFGQLLVIRATFFVSSNLLHSEQFLGRDPLSQNFRLEFSKISLSNGTVISTRSRSMTARAKFSAKIQNGGYAIVLVCFRVKLCRRFCAN